MGRLSIIGIHARCGIRCLRFVGCFSYFVGLTPPDREGNIFSELLRLHTLHASLVSLAYALTVRIVHLDYFSVCPEGARVAPQFGMYVE